MERKEHADGMQLMKNIAEETSGLCRIAEDALGFHKMEALGLFADGVARDLNNILSQIIGFCDLALEDAPSGGDREDNLRRALEATERAKQPARRIQVIGRRSFSPKKNVLLLPLIEETVGLLKIIPPASVTVETDLQPDTRAVLADPTEIPDQTMKDIGGFELAGQIRAQRPDLPVVLCTGHLSEVSAETAETVGIERYLIKPLTRKEPARTVRDVLDKKQI